MREVGMIGILIKIVVMAVLHFLYRALAPLVPLP